MQERYIKRQKKENEPDLCEEEEKVDKDNSPRQGEDNGNINQRETESNEDEFYSCNGDEKMEG